MKTAVVLLNLGGPDCQEAVKPFLFNMFRDKAIIRVPQPMRTLIAWLISTKRAPIARAIYAQLGGGSPIVAETQKQADALQAKLGEGYRTFIAMRYWHPRADEAKRQIREWGADRVVLLPLYPQFSTATTASSFAEWPESAARVCCYPFAAGFVDAYAALIRERLKPGMRVLFSAHGLPEKIVKAGDPYQWQVEQSVAAVVKALGSVEHVICYQSRVGPLKWIGPSTEDEIKRAGAEGKDILLVPVAFVSEHSETLVELDIEYAHLATTHGVKNYVRVPAVGTHPAFINTLAELVKNASGLAPDGGKRLCPPNFTGCPCKE